MTTDRDVQRRLDAWLDLMPSDVPDRVIDSVLLAAQSTPQVRRRLVGGPRRSRMNRFALIAVAAVLGTVLLGGVVLTAGSRPATPVPTAQPVPPATPAATAAAQPSSPAPTLDAALQYRWIGSPRDIGVRGQSTRTALNFAEDAFHVTGTSYGYGPTFLTSAASIGSDGRLRLETTAPGSGCDVGAVGTYAWSLSPGGTVLAVEPGDDACTARMAALPGTWYRVACTDTADGCWGLLEAGSYPSQYIDPRLDIGDAWEPRLGAITYTVPDGWANSGDLPNTLTLTPAADYALETEKGPPAGTFHEIMMFTQPFAAVQGPACTDTADTSVPRTVTGLISWLRTLPGLAVSAAEDVTIDGYDGSAVDLRVADGWSATCEGETAPGVAYFAQAGDRDDHYGVGIAGKEAERLILLDLGSGDVLGIVIDSSDPTRFDELAAAAEPVIQSLQFR